LLPEDLGESADAAEVLEHPRYKPLSPGDFLRAYLPPGLAIEQDDENDGIRVHEPGRVADTFYHRCPAPEQITAEYAKRIREILIKGQVRGQRINHHVFFSPVFGWFLIRSLISHRDIPRGANLNSLAVFALAMDS